MATLKSEDDSYLSTFTITPLKTLDIAVASSFTKTTQNQTWQLVDLAIASGKRSLAFTSDPAQTVEAFTAEVEDIHKIAHSYALCRTPTDEAAHLVTMLDELVNGNRGKLFFEPAEPSFELTINNVGGGWRVELFIDAGNVETGIYRWDSLGIRFFTTGALLRGFHDELKAEFQL